MYNTECPLKYSTIILSILIRFINSSISAGCFLYRAWESIVIGMIGAAIAAIATPLFDKMKVDDPVGASAVHGACGLWGS